LSTGLLSSALASALAVGKGRNPLEWAFWGFCFGPIGLAVLASLPGKLPATSKPGEGPSDASADLPWLDEFGEPRSSPSQAELWLRSLDNRQRERG
jgi:hypothetical protein